MNKLILMYAFFICTSSSAIAWDGYDYGKGRHVEIESGNLVRSGNDIEIYEYGRGYRDVTVESITRSGSTVELEVYDHSTGEYRTLEMDGD